jgi:uroporphyrinogen III methyltransferase/synthase
MTALAGKRVVVTRALEQAGTLRSALEAEGAYVVLCPTIRVAPPDSYAALDTALGRLGEYGWVVFTSANGVRFTLDRMAELGLGPASLRWHRVAAVGMETERTLAARGVGVTFSGVGEGAAGLAEVLPEVLGAAVLLARSDLADATPVEILARRGARRVDDVVVYRTVPTPPKPEAIAELERGVDALTFTSPSTVRGLSLVPRHQDLLAGAAVATIGPSTSAAAREAGFTVHAEAEEPNAAGLVRAVAAALSRRAERDASPR